MSNDYVCDLTEEELEYMRKLHAKIDCEPERAVVLRMTNKEAASDLADMIRNNRLRAWDMQDMGPSEFLKRFDAGEFDD